MSMYGRSVKSSRAGSEGFRIFFSNLSIFEIKNVLYLFLEGLGFSFYQQNISLINFLLFCFQINNETLLIIVIFPMDTYTVVFFCHFHLSAALISFQCFLKSLWNYILLDIKTFVLVLEFKMWHCGINQGPLNIWTEHSNCQIHSRGAQKPL